MTGFRGWNCACSVFLLCVATVITSSATTFKTRANFDGGNGAAPYFGSLVQGTDGNLYGTTAFGGGIQNCAGSSCGTLFKVTLSGTITTLHDFDNGIDGGDPEGGLVQGTDGNFYGVTASGGASGYGTVIRITPAGRLTTLYSFGNSTDGGNPIGGLVEGTGGTFYGTTSYGGGNPCTCGTVFRVTSAGKLTTLHTFIVDGTDGNYPVASLVRGTNGNFYGTTSGGGTNGFGTVFEITPSGKLTILHSFDGTDGGVPEAGLIQGSDGNFYGTTSGGHTGFGTVFKITPSGKLTTLHSFEGTDGANPWAGLIQATDENFYGTTVNGGASNFGTVFKITSNGNFKTLHSFDGTDGATAQGGLVQATNGSIYGTTTAGGTSGNCSYGCGTVYSLSVGLKPFVAIRPASGKEGTKIDILGQGFSSSSVVKFGGTRATTVTRTGTTYITATVPSGALTGPVTVSTGSTKLTSSQTFDVAPTITSFDPPSGPVGTSVTIKGMSLKQTTKVTFDGKSSGFTVINDTEVTADVPTGAVTGRIEVTTKGGTATSKTSFTVN